MVETIVLTNTPRPGDLPGSRDRTPRRVEPVWFVYLAGPMSGKPLFNFPAFHSAARNLRTVGHVVFSPAEQDIERHGVDISEGNLTGDASIGVAAEAGLNIRTALADDTAWICRHATHIALLPGWESSPGARAEHALAAALKLGFIYL